MKQKYITLLKKLNTDRVLHQRGTLYDHLTGTYNYLASWQSQEHICSAGLFHSIYGTTIFRHQSISHANREQIKKLIGERAEDLVYTFSTINRPPSLLTAIRNGYLLDTISQTKKTVSREKLEELIEIEIANLLEQGNGRLFLKGLLREVSEGNILLREPILCVIQNTTLL